MSADEKVNEPGTESTSELAGNDAGTKGTGSAGLQAGDAPDSAAAGEESNADLAGNDAGTKGTGSAG